jgi:hypothetical protein
MKNMVKLQAMLRIAGIIALTAVIVCTMAACDPEGEDPNSDSNYLRLDPKDVTVTIKNTLTGNDAADITGVKVIGADNTGYIYLIGTESAYDTSYTVATNGTPVTLPKVTVPVNKGELWDDKYLFEVSVSLSASLNGTTVAIYVLDPGELLPSTLTLNLTSAGLKKE